MEAIETKIRSCERSTGRTKSYFAKRLEQHLAEKGIKIPSQILALFDTPFSEFSPALAKTYEQKIKGQGLDHIFSDMLVEIYEKVNADRSGWESAANFLEETPMKVCALYALERIDQLNKIEEDDYVHMVEEFSGLYAGAVTPQTRKYNVRPYMGNKSHWWKRDEMRYAGFKINEARKLMES